MPDITHVVANLQRAVEAAKAELLPAATDIKAKAKPFYDPIADIHETWSGSNVGPHAVLYFKDFKRPSVDEQWDGEWGFIHRQDPGWRERTSEEVVARIEAAAGHSVGALIDQGEKLKTAADRHHHDILVILDGVPDELAKRSGLYGRKKAFQDLPPARSANEIAVSVIGQNHMSRDSVSMNKGIWTAPHQTVQGQVGSANVCALRAEKIVEYAERCLAAARSSQLMFQEEQRSAQDAIEVQPAISSPPTWTVRLSATAVVVVMLAVAVACLWGTSVVGERELQSSGTGTVVWRVVAGIVGAAGMLSLVLAGFTLFYGAVRGTASFMETAVKSAWGWGVAAGGVAALAYIFGLA